MSLQTVRTSTGAMWPIVLLKGALATLFSHPILPMSSDLISIKQKMKSPQDLWIQAFRGDRVSLFSSLNQVVNVRFVVYDTTNICDYISLFKSSTNIMGLSYAQYCTFSNTPIHAMPTFSLSTLWTHNDRYACFRSDRSCSPPGWCQAIQQTAVPQFLPSFLSFFIYLFTQQPI